MSMLPIFLKLDGRRCLLVGAGNVALDKVNSLLKTGAPGPRGLPFGAGVEDRPSTPRGRPKRAP